MIGVAPPDEVSLDALESLTLRVNRALEDADAAVAEVVIGGQLVPLDQIEAPLRAMSRMTDHDQLQGLPGSVSHLLFLLLDGTRAMTGDLNVDTHAVSWEASNGAVHTVTMEGGWNVNSGYGWRLRDLDGAAGDDHYLSFGTVDGNSCLYVYSKFGAGNIYSSYCETNNITTRDDAGTHINVHKHLEFQSDQGVYFRSVPQTIGINSPAANVLGLVASSSIRLTTTAATDLTVPVAKTLVVGGYTEIGARPAAATYAYLGNASLDHSVAGNYAIIQSTDGYTYVNAAASKALAFRINNVSKFTLQSTGHVLVAGTKQWQFGDAGTYILQPADSVLGLVADGYVRIGNSGTPGRGTGDGCLFVKEQLEVGGDIWIQTTGATNARFLIGATGTGLAGVFLDGSNGDIAGGDYASIVQQNDLNVVLMNRGTGKVLFFATQATNRVQIDGSGNMMMLGQLRMQFNDANQYMGWDGTDLIIATSGRVLFGATGNDEAQAAKWHVSATGNEYINSGAANYLDLYHNSGGGLRIYDDANLLWTISRWSGAVPTKTKVTVPVQLNFVMGATDTFQIASSGMWVKAGTLRLRYDNLALEFGSGPGATGDASMYYDANNMIYKILTAGKHLFGAAGGDELVAVKLHLGEDTEFLAKIGGPRIDVQVEGGSILGIAGATAGAGLEVHGDIDMDFGKVLKVNSVQVVGGQQAHLADPAADAGALATWAANINTLLETHGLMANA